MPYSSISGLDLRPSSFSISSSTGSPWVSQPRFARHAVALHRLVARDQVLEGACEDVVDAGPRVRRRRAFVEDEQAIVREARLRLAFDRPLEDGVVLPEAEDILLQPRKAHPGIDGLEHLGTSRVGCAQPWERLQRTVHDDHTRDRAQKNARRPAANARDERERPRYHPVSDRTANRRPALIEAQTRPSPW